MSKIRKNSGKIGKKEEKSGRKVKNREVSFTLTLLTDRAGYATANDGEPHLLYYMLYTSFRSTKHSYAMQHIKRWDLAEATCFSFITMIIVNVSHATCCFIDCFMEQVFQRTWVFSIEGWHQLIST